MASLLLPKSTFIHIPKCAGTFVGSFLSELGIPVTAYKKPHGHLFPHQMTESYNRYNFTFVRHPYTWWPSFYEWSKKRRNLEIMLRKREAKVSTNYALMANNVLEIEDFNIWIQYFGSFNLGMYSNILSRYLNETSLVINPLKVNYIGKIENLYEDLYTALTLAEEEFDKDKFKELAQSAKTNNNLIANANAQGYNKHITEESKELIYQAEKYAFDRFQYKHL
jgi:hypothetical protein